MNLRPIPLALALFAVAATTGAAWAQVQQNPWTPEAGAPAQYPPSGNQFAPAGTPGGTGWGIAQPATSLYAPADLEQQLSATPPVMAPTLATPVAPAPAQPTAQPRVMAPASQAPGAVPAAPQAYPGMAPNGGLGYRPTTPVVPGVATYPGAAPYGAAGGWPGYGNGYGNGYGYGLPYGGGYGYPGTGWGNGTNNTGWPGSGGSWPFGGFSPFGFW